METLEHSVTPTIQKPRSF